jgi:hypothetical protein
MSKKIKELAEQAGFLNKEEESIEYFAELIIKECAKVCLSMPLIGPYKDVQDATLKDAAMQIKEYFEQD